MKPGGLAEWRQSSESREVKAAQCCGAEHQRGGVLHAEKTQRLSGKHLQAPISEESLHVKTSLRAGRRTTHKEQMEPLWRGCRAGNGGCSHQPEYTHESVQETL